MSSISSDSDSTETFSTKSQCDYETSEPSLSQNHQALDNKCQKVQSPQPSTSKIQQEKKSGLFLENIFGAGEPSTDPLYISFQEREEYHNGIGFNTHDPFNLSLKAMNSSVYKDSSKEKCTSQSPSLNKDIETSGKQQQNQSTGSKQISSNLFSKTIRLQPPLLKYLSKEKYLMNTSRVEREEQYYFNYFGLFDDFDSFQECDVHWMVNQKGCDLSTEHSGPFQQPQLKKLISKAPKEKVSGFGSVYILEREQLAVKIPSGPFNMARLLEAQILLSNDHRNLHQSNHFFLFEARFYYTLDLSCICLSLEHIVGKVTKHQANYIAKQIANGLDYLHDHQIIHRDLRPANIFVLRDLVQIGNFSSACHATYSHISQTNISISPYVSPEQWKTNNLTTKADIWGWAIIYTELLSGIKGGPFHAMWDFNDLTLKKNLVLQKTQPLKPTFSSQTVLYCLSKGEFKLVFKCLSQDPTNRLSALQCKNAKVLQTIDPKIVDLQVNTKNLLQIIINHS